MVVIAAVQSPQTVWFVVSLRGASRGCRERAWQCHDRVRGAGNVENTRYGPTRGGVQYTSRVLPEWAPVVPGSGKKTTTMLVHAAGT